jgi:hypothetical protein
VQVTTKVHKGKTFNDKRFNSVIAPAPEGFSRVWFASDGGFGFALHCITSPDKGGLFNKKRAKKVGTEVMGWRRSVKRKG